MKKHLTIKEYADKRGCSVSAVYKRLEGTLQPYVEEVEGNKVLKYQVLIDEGLEGVEDVELNPSSTVEEQNSTQFDRVLQVLTAQLEEKDKQIEKLQEELQQRAAANEEKDKYIQEQGRRLTELLEQSNKLQENNQVLLGLANDYKTKLEEVSSSSTPANEKGFFRRFFR